jgi:predicted esterase
MSYKSDPQIFTDAYHLYLEGQFQNAYDLLTEAGPKYPGEGLRVAEWRMDIAARLGHLELAEQILEKAINSGYFYGEFALRKDEDMQIMQGRPIFEALVKRNLEVLAVSQKNASPELEIINVGKAGDRGKPLLLALHGNNSNVKRFKDYWAVLLGSEWMVALPQSSQVNGKDIYVWNDLAVVERELRNHYKELIQKHTIDQFKTIVSGFSKGGHAAIEAALKGYFPMRGFLAVAPYIGDRDAMLKLLDSTDNKHLRGYFLIGEKDHECAPGAIWMVEEFEKRSFHCKMKVVPGLAHDFPEDFDAILPDILNFILTDS